MYSLASIVYLTLTVKLTFEDPLNNHQPVPVADEKTSLMPTFFESRF